MRLVDSKMVLTLLKCLLVGAAGWIADANLYGQDASMPASDAVLASTALSARALPEAFFEEDVLPMLTKLGCNAGSCHGAAAGRGYLCLSLFGSDPTSDYHALVQEFQGRRIRFSDPESSLLLAKPTGRLAHGGNVVIDPESPEARSLIDWIANGAPRGESSEAHALRLESEPIEGDDGRARFRLRAIARDKLGRPRDVTHLAQFLIDASSPVKWDDASATASLEVPGKHVVLARYMGRIASVTLTKRYASAEGIAQDEPTEAHWIDRYVSAGLRELRVVPEPPVEALDWLRRASLDIAGRLPSLEWIEQFEQDVAPERRRRWIERLADTEGYIDVWTLRMARWLEFRSLANEPLATQAFSNWMRRAIAEDRSMRDVARELLLSTGDSQANGPANFARMANDARLHAEMVSRVFLGARLQCANCHNHPFDRWTQDDYHGLAAIFSVVERGREVRWLDRGDVTNLRTGQPAVPRIPGFKNLPSNAGLPPGSNLHGFAEWLLDEDNPIFARVLVNRVWHAMMGQGIVEPVDDFRETNPPSNPELLDALVEHFRRSGYRLRPLVMAIAESNAYARRCGQAAERQSSFFGLFARGIARRLPPEVLLDAVHDALGTPYSQSLDRSADGNSDALPGLRDPRAVHELDPTIPHVTLDRIGRCSRTPGCDSHLGRLGLAQQLHWVNGAAVNSLLSSEDAFFSQRLDEGRSDAEILQEAYLRILCRHATARDIHIWLPRIPADLHERRAWYQDWIWSMLSSNAFLMNR